MSAGRHDLKALMFYALAWIGGFFLILLAIGLLSPSRIASFLTVILVPYFFLLFWVVIASRKENVQARVERSHGHKEINARLLSRLGTTVDPKRINRTTDL